MSFEFFNTSRLAFGSKLTAAFQQLDNNKTYALENLNRVLSDLDYYQQYIDKNYRVPIPTREGMAVRVNELFAIIDDIVAIKKLEYDNGLLSVEITFFTKNTNKATNAIGSTELKEGYAFVMPSPSNTRLTRNIRFSANNDKTGSEVLLFEFRIGTDNHIYLKGNLTSILKLYPQDATQYRSLTRGEYITFPYTAQDYECLCVVGYDNNTYIAVNGQTIIAGGGSDKYLNRNHAILYVKKGDVVSGNINYGFKINYNY